MIPGSQKCFACTGRRHRASARSFKTIRAVRPLDGGRSEDWYARQQWLVGSNYIPQNAINQLEMWQAQTFDAAEIDKELVGPKT